jgi:hypothetical protein
VALFDVVFAFIVSILLLFMLTSENYIIPSETSPHICTLVIVFTYYDVCTRIYASLPLVIVFTYNDVCTRM